MEITKYRKQGRIEVRFFLINPNEHYPLSDPVDQLADQLAYGFSTMFDMKGKIINVD
jgi:hypothetical protein